jgi:hypothetical protein
MNRREFIAVLAGGAVAQSTLARAEEAQKYQ